MLFLGTLVGSKQGWANLVDIQVARPQPGLVGKREVEELPLWAMGDVEKLALSVAGDHCRLHLVDRAVQSDKLRAIGKW